jgi:hypothetical protein
LDNGFHGWVKGCGGKCLNACRVGGAGQGRGVKDDAKCDSAKAEGASAAKCGGDAAVEEGAGAVGGGAGADGAVSSAV